MKFEIITDAFSLYVLTLNSRVVMVSPDLDSIYFEMQKYNDIREAREKMPFEPAVVGNIGSTCTKCKQKELEKLMSDKSDIEKPDSKSFANLFNLKP